MDFMMGGGDLNIEQGMIVCAKAGRDKEGLFVAVLLKDGYVYIADGKRRKVENPKRKNPRHLTALSKSPDCGQYQTNRSVKRVLRGFLEEQSKESL